MRTAWNHGELLFSTEQAYRFVRRLTDAGGAITWANTVNGGAMNPQGLGVLKEVDAKMAKHVKPPYVTYKRPEHAALINN